MILVFNDFIVFIQLVENRLVWTHYSLNYMKWIWLDFFVRLFFELVFFSLFFALFNSTLFAGKSQFHGFISRINIGINYQFSIHSCTILLVNEMMLIKSISMDMEHNIYIVFSPTQKFKIQKENGETENEGIDFSILRIECCITTCLAKNNWFFVLKTVFFACWLR